MINGRKRRRVAHVLDTCFSITGTFLYAYVTGCKRFESWCLPRDIQNADQFPFSRIELTTIQRRSSKPWDLVDRVLDRVHPDHRLPLYRALAKVRPAIVHAHFAPVGFQVMHICRRFGLPFLTSFYGWDASTLPQLPGGREALTELFKRGTAFTGEGPAMVERLRQLGCPAEKIFLLPISIHADRYRYHPRTLQAGEILRLLFVGRFVPKKGLPVLLRALQMAGPELGPYELRVIGSEETTDGTKVMERIAEELGIRRQVTFLGFQPHAKTIEEIDNAHVLAMPSHTAPDGDTEGGAPTIGLDAQATGLPIVSTTHADIPYTVAPGGREFLAREDSADDFAAKLVAMRRAAGRWPELGREGRAHVVKQHGPRNFDLLEDIYDRVIEKHRNSGLRVRVLLKR